MRSAELFRVTKTRASPFGFDLINALVVSRSFGACISSRFSSVIHVGYQNQINYSCYNEPFAVSPTSGLYWDMHGLIFETSIWPLAGSTRYLYKHIKIVALQSNVWQKSRYFTNINSPVINKTVVRYKAEFKYDQQYLAKLLTELLIENTFHFILSLHKQAVLIEIDVAHRFSFTHIPRKSTE